jgi:transposase-like protein
MTSCTCCPSCGAIIELAVRSPGAEQQARWASLRDVAKETGQPASRLRRWVREGRLDARRGPRGAHMIRPCDVQELLEELPVVQPSQPDVDAGDDEVLRLVAGV